MTRDYKIVTSFWFIAGLILLLVNDLLLKGVWNNWLTGKLSDFAGLFIFPLFWRCLFPKWKRSIILLTAVTFVYWKSPLSQPFINSWNSWGILPVNRVVDYSDLSALAVLPISYAMAERKSMLSTIQLHPGISLSISAFAFLATSYHSKTAAVKEFSFAFPKDTLAKRLYYLPSIENKFRQDSVLYRLDSAQTYRIHVNNWDTIPAQGAPIHLFVQDTMNIRIYDKFCFDGYTAKIIVSGNQKASMITLIGFEHACPQSNKQDSELLDSFESKVIKEIQVE